MRTAGHDMLRLVNRRILLSIISDRQPVSRAEISAGGGVPMAFYTVDVNGAGVVRLPFTGQKDERLRVRLLAAD